MGLDEAKFRLRLAVDALSWDPGDEGFSKYLRYVQKEERDRIMRFRFVKDRKLALVGRLLMRHVVRTALGVPWRDIVIERTTEGKPFLAKPLPHAVNIPSSVANFNFNISHHGRYVVLASEPVALVGVDVMETFYDRTDPERFLRDMRDCFTSSEWAIIESPLNDGGTTEQTLINFFTNWVLKESLIKAMGIGLGFELQRSSFKYASIHDTPLSRRRQGMECSVAVDGKEASQWRFVVHDVDDDGTHVAAVAVSPPEEAVESWRATPYFCYHPVSKRLIAQAVKESAVVPFTTLTVDDLIDGVDLEE